MTYAKPELVVLTPAVEAIQYSTLKHALPNDSNTEIQTPSAYEDDE